MDNKVNTLPDMPPETIPNFAAGEKPDDIPDFNPEKITERALNVTPDLNRQPEDVVSLKKETIEIIDRGLISNQHNQRESDDGETIDEKNAIEEEKESARRFMRGETTPAALYEDIIKTRARAQSLGRLGLENTNNKEVA